MLGIRGAAAIADDQQLVAVPERRNDRIGDLSRSRQHRGILRRALERRERQFEMAGDNVLVQDAPSGFVFVSLGNDRLAMAQVSV